MKKSGERGAYGVADEKEFIIITKAKDLAFHTYDMTTARRFCSATRFLRNSDRIIEKK